MAPVVKELERYPAVFQSAVCVTAQHRQMLDQVLNLFDIRPVYDLDIMKSGQNLFDITCSALQGLKVVLEKERPDMVLVMRETTERPEAVNAGTLKLVGTSKRKILEETNLPLSNPDEYKKMSTTHNPYGDGKASERIVQYLLLKFCATPAPAYFH